MYKKLIRFLTKKKMGGGGVKTKTRTIEKLSKK